jgi:hypothetical protein
MLANIWGINVKLRPHALRSTPHVRQRHGVGNEKYPCIDTYKHKSSQMDMSIVLPSGERICVNGAAFRIPHSFRPSRRVFLDHVYSAAPWGLRDSNLAYSIGRVMEFLPAITRRPANTPERVRIAWYYRPSDLSERSTDSRLLLAAIYSEVQPVSYIRGKCYVRHRDMISNLAAWKKQPDCFYFYRFFDPYIKKEYEVLLSRDVNNREFPVYVRSVLF